MSTIKNFKIKDEDTMIGFSVDQVDDIIPDADMRFSLVVLKNGEKHFVEGRVADIKAQLLN